MRKSLKDQVKHFDAESILEVAAPANTTPVSTAIATNAEFRINNNRLKTLDLEDEASAAAEVLSDMIEVTESVQDKIEETLENLDTMSPMAIGAAVGSIQEKANQVVDLAEDKIDAEARMVDPRGTARVDLEGITESLKSVGDTIKNAFKSSKTKLDETFSAVPQWEKDITARTSGLEADLKDVSKDATLKENAATLAKSKLGNKLATVNILGVDIKDLPSFANDLLAIDNYKSEGKIGSKIKAKLEDIWLDEDVEKDDVILPSRLDGVHIGLVVLSKVDNAVGFKELVSTTMPSSLAKTITIDSKDLTLAYAKELIATAKTLAKSLPTVSAGLEKEASTIASMLNGDIEKSKFEPSSLFQLGIWGWFLLGGTLGGIASLISASRDGKKTFEELTAKEKYKVLNARVKLTSKYAVDALFGLNNLINELLDYAKIIINLYSSEVDKEDLEEVELTLNVNLPEAKKEEGEENPEDKAPEGDTPPAEATPVVTVVNNTPAPVVDATSTPATV